MLLRYCSAAAPFLVSAGEPASDDKQLQLAYAVDAIHNIVTPSLGADGIADAGGDITPEQLAPIQVALAGALKKWEPGSGEEGDFAVPVSRTTVATQVQAVASFAEVCKRLVDSHSEEEASTPH